MGCGFLTRHVAAQATDGHVQFPGRGILCPSWEVETIQAGEHPREGQRRGDEEEAGRRHSHGRDLVNIAERRARCDHSTKAQLHLHETLAITFVLTETERVAPRLASGACRRGRSCSETRG